MKHQLYDIPSVHDILNDHSFDRACGALSHVARSRLVRATLHLYRERLRTNATERRLPPPCTPLMACVDAARLVQQRFPKRVINGTGVLLHTNLGRCPLGPPSGPTDSRSLGGYSSVEWDFETQERGDRCRPVELRLQLLTGAEAAVLVNNCAGALLLALSAVASGREVLVSRSEMIEIGGGFRIPEVIALSGCILREIGTTNKTRLNDFERNASPGSVLLKVHQSNFYQKGFVEQVSIEGMVALGRQFGMAVIEDNGSGLVVQSSDATLANEPSVLKSVALGVDAVCFSADKMFGSVQAGIVVGKSALVSKMRTHPLYRAIRLDKGRIASLHEVLGTHLAGRTAEIPLWHLRNRTLEQLQRCLDQLDIPLHQTDSLSIRCLSLQATFGGGSNPDKSFASLGLELHHREISPDALRRYFGARAIPIIGYIRKRRFIIDVRAFFDADFDELRDALSELKLFVRMEE